MPEAPLRRWALTMPHANRHRLGPLFLDGGHVELARVDAVRENAHGLEVSGHLHHLCNDRFRKRVFLGPPQAPTVP